MLALTVDPRLDAAAQAGWEAWEAAARAAGAETAVLKARSPSCGSRQVYDGAFRRRLVPGAGVTASALRAAGVHVVSEEDLPG